MRGDPTPCFLAGLPLGATRCGLSWAFSWMRHREQASASADRPEPTGTVKGGGMEDAEADARVINAEPWEPPPGMVKRQCPDCRYFFAAPSTEPEAVLLCPDCAAAGTRTVLHH